MSTTACVRASTLLRTVIRLIELGAAGVETVASSTVVASLVAGGHDTTVVSLTNLFYKILARPEIKQRLLDDPSLIPAAVEESLRLHLCSRASTGPSRSRRRSRASRSARATTCCSAGRPPTATRSSSRIRCPSASTGRTPSST